MNNEEVTLTKGEFYAIAVEMILGTALVAALTIRFAKDVVPSPYVYVAGFVVAWVLLYPLMSVGARRYGKSEPAGKYAIRGVIGTVAASIAAIVIDLIR